MSLLKVADLGVQLGARDIVRDATFELDRGECVALLGPNGAGKTSLMRAALGLIAHSGDSSLAKLPPAQRARQAAWIPQKREIAWPVSVQSLIMLGRIPHLATGQTPSALDNEKVAEAMKIMHLDRFAHRAATELSGGEQARLLIARALAQDTPLLIADEPVAGLDPAHQLATMEIFRDLAQQGRGVLISLHDIGLALRYCSRVIILCEGRIVKDDIPATALTGATLEQVFGITAFQLDTADGPIFQPLAAKPIDQ